MCIRDSNCLYHSYICFRILHFTFLCLVVKQINLRFYIDDIIQSWRQDITSGIRLNQNTSLDILLYADDAVLIQEIEDELEYSLHHLNNICKQYDIQVSKEKTKIVAFLGKFLVRTKIVLERTVLEQFLSLNI